MKDLFKVITVTALLTLGVLYGCDTSPHSDDAYVKDCDLLEYLGSQTYSTETRYYYSCTEKNGAGSCYDKTYRISIGTKISDELLKAINADSKTE